MKRNENGAKPTTTPPPTGKQTRKSVARTLPLLEDSLLKGTAVRERKVPGALALNAVDLVQDNGGLLLGHAAREEHDARDGNRDRVLEHTDSGTADVSVRALALEGSTGAHHVGLQEGALKDDMVVRQGLVLSGKDALGDLRGGRGYKEQTGVASIGENENRGSGID